MKTFVPSHFSLALAFVAIVAFCSCAPQREFVQFGNPATFHPGPRHSGGESSGHDGE
jgi:hypothetical protein